eukprot:PRCOL_00006041-RA
MAAARCAAALARPAAARQRVRRALARAADRPKANFVDKVLEGLPIVGVVRALLSPEGLKTRDVGYQEYSRAVYEAAPKAFSSALMRLRSRRGAARADARFVLFCMWAAANGAALPALNRLSIDMQQEGLIAIRRLSVQRDLEYEVEVFEQLRTDPSVRSASEERPPSKGQRASALMALLRELLLLGNEEGDAQQFGEDDLEDIAHVLRAFDEELQEDEIAALLAGSA